MIAEAGGSEIVVERFDVRSYDAMVQRQDRGKENAFQDRSQSGMHRPADRPGVGPARSDGIVGVPVS